MDTTSEEETLPSSVDEVAAWMASGVSDAAIEAQAGWWLRSVGELEMELFQLDAREEAERERLTAHYARQRAPLTDRIAALTRCVIAIAERMTYPKGRKSLAMTWGTIGRRTVPARVSVADASVAVGTARALLPSAIRIKESVDVRAITAAVMTAVADGVVVDGFEVVPEHEAAYAKTSSAVTAGVA